MLGKIPICVTGSRAGEAEGEAAMGADGTADGVCERARKVQPVTAAALQAEQRNKNVCGAEEGDAQPHDALARSTLAEPCQRAARSGPDRSSWLHSIQALRPKTALPDFVYILPNTCVRRAHPPRRHDTLADAAATTGRRLCGDNTTSSAYNCPG